MAESEEELRNLLIRVKEEREKADLKLNPQKTKTMESGPITLWQIDGKKVETVEDFIFCGSKITVYGYWSHEIKRLGKKGVTNLDSILKSRGITLPTTIYGSGAANLVCVITVLIYQEGFLKLLRYLL